MNIEYFYKTIGYELNSWILDMLRKRGVVMPPRFVAWDCTRRCNLNCEHCGAKKEIYPKELSTDEMKKLIDEIAAYGVRYFGVTGGEPLLRLDLLAIFEYAKQKGLSTTLATNGFLINEWNANTIARVFDSVQISLDGPKDIHNKIRGNDEAYERATSAIKRLRENGDSQLTVSSVIMPRNFSHFDELAQVVGNLPVNIWKIILVMPIGRAEENVDLNLSREQFLSLVELIKKYRKKWRGEIKIDVGENAAYLGEYDSQARMQPFFCPVGFSTCCIGADGNVRGCPEQPDTEYFREGNILQKSFKEIWESGFKKYRDNEYLKDATCASCRYHKKCRGGCWVNKVKGKICAAKEYCC